MFHVKFKMEGDNLVDAQCSIRMQQKFCTNTPQKHSIPVQARPSYCFLYSLCVYGLLGVCYRHLTENIKSHNPL